jgi:hypothetical protein
MTPLHEAAPSSPTMPMHCRATQVGIEWHLRGSARTTFDLGLLGFEQRDLAQVAPAPG